MTASTASYGSPAGHGISIGLVGLGAFGSEFADLFMSHPLVNRIALCDREPERMARIADRPGWQRKLDADDLYPTLDAICRSDLEALVIVTQPWLHAAHCVQALESGKPEKILDKIVDGKLAKFKKESCLLQQAFVKDPDITVEDLLNDMRAKTGENVQIRRFVRWELGEAS